MAELRIPVSLGELVDKITILEIKLERLSGAAREHARQELELLQGVLNTEAPAIDPELWQELRAVNRSLWEIEDAIRQQERLGDFGPRFIELARSVYHRNDRRAAVKRLVNERHGSAIVEEKSYAPY